MVVFLLFCIISLLYFWPIHYIPEVLEILSPSISIINIVRMFPYITSQKWYEFLVRKRSSCIRCWDNLKSSIRFLHEPSPSRTKCRECHLVEFYLKWFHISPFLNYLRKKWFWKCWNSSWSKRIKIEGMIPYLGSIIEYTTSRILNNIFEWLILEFCSGNELVEIIYIRLVMFSRMELESFLRDIWSECIKCIWKRRSSKHSFILINIREYIYFRKISNLYENLFHNKSYKNKFDKYMRKSMILCIVRCKFR